jgi:hypothetical protein
MAGIVDVYQRPVWDLGSVADATSASADLEAGSASYDFGPVWHDGTPNDLVATPTVEALDFVQEHALSLSDLESVSSVDASALGQYHNIRPLDLISASQVEALDFVQEHALSLSDLESVSSVEALDFVQEHALSLSDLESVSSVDASALGQYHNIRPLDLISASQIDPADVRKPNALELAPITAQPTLSHHFDTLPLDITAQPTAGRAHLVFVSRTFASQARARITVRQIATTVQTVQTVQVSLPAQSRTVQSP